MELNKIKKLSNILSDTNQNIVLVTHVNPDGDAIGSCLGLYNFLSEAGFDSISVITPNDYASFLKWMPGNEIIIIASENQQKAIKIISEAEIIFCLDFNDLERTDNLSQLINDSKALKVLIDHHPQPVDGFDYKLSYTEASSTAEIIYDFIRTLKSGKDLVNKDIAACLYTGIMTDTGSFSYGCSNPETFLICAELVKTGIDPEHIHRLVYNTNSVNRMKLLGYCLSEKLKVMSEYNTAYICLTIDDLEKFDYQEGDTEGIVNYALSIRDIDFAALFAEKQDHVKISLRSIGDIDVNEFARKYLNGGGHKNAAGGKYYDEISKTVKYFESIIVDFRKGITK